KAWVLAGLGAAEATAGRRSEAVRIIAQLERAQQHGEADAYSLVVYAALGEVDPAMHWLQKSFDQRIGSLILLKMDPDVDSLRKDPRFGELLRRMRLDP